MKTILYVEDKPHVRENVIRLLSGPGDFFKVLAAGTILEAIDLIDHIKIDLVIVGRRIHSKEVDMLDHSLRRHNDIKMVLMADRKSRVSGLLKAFEYKMQLEVPVDIALLLEMLLCEFGINTGGQMRGISIASFLQMIELEGQTCTIRVLSAGKSGYLYCVGGDLIDAQIDDMKGKEAAFAIFSMENALIMVDYDTLERQQTIDVPLMSLLLESGRIKDEMVTKPNERRRYKRYPCSLPVEFVYNEWSHQAVVSDISHGGAFIRTKEPFSAGEEIQVSFYSQSLDKRCHIGGIIVRRDPDGIGVQFATIHIHQMSILRAVIHEVAGG